MSNTNSCSSLTAVAWNSFEGCKYNGWSVRPISILYIFNKSILKIVIMWGCIYYEGVTVEAIK